LPLTNLKVRQAIARTIDVRALLKAIGRDKTGQVASQLLSPVIPGYNPDIMRPAINLDAARSLIKQAGYPNGAEITLTVFSAAKDVADEVTRQLGHIGLRVHVITRDDSDGLLTDANAGKFEMS
jgi:ABC-type transport system substrate-binding protein